MDDGLRIEFMYLKRKTRRSCTYILYYRQLLPRWLVTYNEASVTICNLKRLIKDVTIFKRNILFVDNIHRIFNNISKTVSFYLLHFTKEIKRDNFIIFFFLTHLTKIITNNSTMKNYVIIKHSLTNYNRRTPGKILRELSIYQYQCRCKLIV